MHGYWLEFLQVALAHFLAVASPGPDFAIVLKQSLTHGRRAAIWTSLGVGSAIGLHVAYSLLGLGLILKNSPMAFTAITYAGAAYLAWLGIQALKTRPRSAEMVATPFKRDHPVTARAAWLTGFLTNALNPKATLFFVALFATLIDPHTPKWIQAGYGVWMVVATASWFCAVSIVFARPSVRTVFLQHGHWVDRALGVVFIAFAVSLALASTR